MREMSLLQGWPGLLAGYATVQAPLLAALAQARAPLRQFLFSPLLAVPLTAWPGPHCPWRCHWRALWGQRRRSS